MSDQPPPNGPPPPGSYPPPYGAPPGYAPPGYAPPGYGYPPGPPVAQPAATRPGFGAIPVVLGALLVALGFLALDWVGNATRSTDFVVVHDAVDSRKSAFNVVTQAYVLYGVLPLLLLTTVAALTATLGAQGARGGVGSLAVLTGLGMVGLVVWVESGGAGTDQSRSDALPFLLLLAAGGLAVVVLGVVAIRERRGVVARVSAALLIAVTGGIHAAVLADVFDGPPSMATGAWLPLVGLTLMLVGVLLPFRREPTGF